MEIVMSSQRFLRGAGLLLVLLFGAPAVSTAATPAIAEAEISHLLAFVENSGCSFNRNGSWYDAARGAAHLRDKYQWLASRGKINSAEDFVEKAATASSMSGEPYEVKCGDASVLPSGAWLRDELARYRACVPDCATTTPGVSRPVPIETPRARATPKHASAQ
jgi:hypothetical protein